MGTVSSEPSFALMFFLSVLSICKKAVAFGEGRGSDALFEAHSPRHAPTPTRTKDHRRKRKKAFLFSVAVLV